MKKRQLKRFFFKALKIQGMDASWLYSKIKKEFL